MPSIRLTQMSADRLAAPLTGRLVYWDRHLPGFGLRISSNGAKSWVAMYRVGGKTVMETIGTLARFPKVDDARKIARDSMAKAARGENPVRIRKDREERAIESTFRVVAQRYLDRYAKKHTKPTTWKEAQRQLAVDVLPKWGERPIASITRQDVIRLLESIEARGSPVQANRTLARLKTLFAWVQREEIITSDPTALVDKVIREQARDRVLDEQEIGLFWSACEVVGWPFGPMGKLLLLTAQRRDEVGGMRWGELDLEKRIWTIPRERAKNNRAHEVYLSDLALEVIGRLPRLETEPGFVFTTTGYSHISGYGKARATLHEIMKALLRQETSDEAATIAQWTFHDLRRTAATGMARLNMPPHDVDRILNHVSGTIRGVAAVYNRFEYLAERKAALEAWGRFVEGLIRPNVVRLASA